MSQDDRDFDEILRRLLREEADAIHPAGDGLERIRSRLTRPRPLPLAWVMAVASDAWHRVLGAARSVAWVETLSGAVSARLGWPRGGRAQRWRSPAVLAAAAVVAVAAAVLALTPLPRQAVSGSALLWRTITGAQGGHTPGQGGGQAEGGSSGPPVPGASSSSPARRVRQQPSASPSLTTAVPSPTSQPAPSASASPTPTPSANPTPTPCPTPSASTSPDSAADQGSGACSTPTPTPTPTPTVSPTTGPSSSPSAPDPGFQ
jgi:hypothetical protein